MGCHLRFGFEATYGRDTVNMRNDNEADYPWLCFALATLMKEYARMHAAGEQSLAREQVVESMLNGLSADARAIIGAPPASLSHSEDERAGFTATFHALKSDLLHDRLFNIEKLKFADGEVNLTPPKLSLHAYDAGGNFENNFSTASYSRNDASRQWASNWCSKQVTTTRRTRRMLGRSRSRAAPCASITAMAPRSSAVST